MLDNSYRTLVDAVVDYAIYLIDVHGRITTWNPGARRLKGYAEEEVIGKHYALFFTEEDRRGGLPETALDIARREGRFESEGWRVRKDGGRFWALAVVSLVRDPSGQPIGFAKVTRDLTERRDAQLRATRLNAELQAANQQLEAFAYTVSHDLRAPLRAMEGFAHILLDDFAPGLDEAGCRYLRRIVAAAERMEGLIDDLLAYSRLQRAELSVQRVEPTEIARLSAETVLRTAPFGGTAIDIAPDLPPVLAEPVVLRRIFDNLLDNAAKFRRREAPVRIEVTGARKGDRVRLSVRDNGIGVAAKHQKQIFGVFERLHGQETYPGTGIGLAIVKTGVERMGGACGVESEEGRGSEFWIEMPAEEGSSA